MRIEHVMIVPDPPRPDNMFEVKVLLHNDSTKGATATINAALNSSDLSFPTRMRQVQITLEKDRSEEVTLFKMIVDKRFRPGQYQVEVWLAGQRGNAAEVQFEIKGVKKAF